MFVFLSRRRIDQIARDHYEVGLWCECVQRSNAALKGTCRIDASVSEHARRFNVQIGNLRDENGFWRHRAVQFSGGNRRTASGAIKSPIRSPALAVMVFGASTVRNLSDAPLTTMRCLSPMKLTLSMAPESGALPASTTLIVSGRIMARAAGRLSSPPLRFRPP